MDSRLEKLERSLKADPENKVLLKALLSEEARLGLLRGSFDTFKPSSRSLEQVHYIVRCGEEVKGKLFLGFLKKENIFVTEPLHFPTYYSLVYTNFMNNYRKEQYPREYPRTASTSLPPWSNEFVPTPEFRSKLFNKIFLEVPWKPIDLGSGHYASGLKEFERPGKSRKGWYRKEKAFEYMRKKFDWWLARVKKHGRFINKYNLHKDYYPMVIEMIDSFYNPKKILKE